MYVHEKIEWNETEYTIKPQRHLTTQLQIKF